MTVEISHVNRCIHPGSSSPNYCYQWLETLDDTVKIRRSGIDAFTHDLSFNTKFHNYLFHSVNSFLLKLYRLCLILYTTTDTITIYTTLVFLMVVSFRYSNMMLQFEPIHIRARFYIEYE